MATPTMNTSLPEVGSFGGYLYDLWKTSGLTGVASAALTGRLPIPTANYYSGAAPETKPLLELQAKQIEEDAPSLSLGDLLPNINFVPPVLATPNLAEYAVPLLALAAVFFAVLFLVRKI